MMVIYKATGEVLIELLPQLTGDNSYRIKEIMGQNIVVLYFSLPEYMEVPVGSYIEFKGEKYHLSTPQNFVMHHTRHYDYTLTLHSEDVKANDVIFKFESDLKFSLTATPAQFAQLFVDNMNGSEPGWTVGQVIESEPVTVDFNKESCMSALGKICEAVKTEYEFDNKVLHIHKIEHDKDHAVELSYGYGNGIMSGLSRQQFDSSRVINRVYVETSDRNINAAEYGSKKLRMPLSQVIEYEGVQYMTSADGTYLERVGRTGRVVEGALDLSKHYPTRTGTVSAVQVIDVDKHLYDIIDSSIPQTLDYSTAIIAGETMTLVFQTGLLAGKEFDVSYKHAERRFELVPLTGNGEIYPYGSLVPEAGDKYKVFNVAMPTVYIQDAEQRVLVDAVAYLHDNEMPKFTYRWKLDGLYAKRNWLDIGGYLKPGNFVMFSDPAFLPEAVPIRITAVKEYLKRPKSPEIDISNSVPGKSVAVILDEIPGKDQTIDRKTEQVKRYSRRRFEDALETMQMLEAAIEGFSAGIDPVSVQTLSLLVGAESLQFRFVNSKTSPSVVTPSIAYNNTTKVLSAPSGIIQHMTLGIASISPSHQPSEYRFWDLPSYASPALIDANKSYYLYAWVPKSGGTGSYLLRDTAQPFDAGTYYYLLIGTLGKETSGMRSYTSVYGFTEILPGSITTDLIKSPTGQTYFNLSAGNGAGEIGGVIKFLAGSEGLENIQSWQELVGLVGDIDDELGLLEEDFLSVEDKANQAAAAAAALEYIKEAILDGSTTVAGGLILANLLMLRGEDDVVRAGLSGLKNDNVFLFADPSNAYAKAIAGTAMFVLRKDGTSKLGIMKIDTDNVGLYKDGTEMMQFRTGNVPTRSDLISSVDVSVIVPGGTDTRSGNYAGNFGNSNAVVTTAPLSSFSLNIYGTINLSSNNDYSTPIIESQVMCNFVLERLQAGVWVYDRIVASEYLFSELPGETSQSHTVNSTINLAVGSYRLRIEYNIDTRSVNDTCSITAAATMHAQGAQANKAIIFGDNGLIRIKDGNNYSLFSDEAVEHKFAADKYLLIDENGIKARGKFDVPGLRGFGSVSSAGSLNNEFGVVNTSARSSQGIYVITHDVGHLFYAVNITPYNSSGQISAVVSSKTNNSFTVRIVNPSNNSLTDSSFDFSIYADA